jgi:DNA/RNA-binding domain of Phe-tRNA-synthetase-like protein
VSGLISVEPDVRARYGEVSLAYLIASDVQVASTPPRLKKRARRVEAQLRSTVNDGPVDPRLVAWREFASRMGLTLDEELPAHLQLLDRILHGWDIPKINNVVDAANIVAAEFLTAVGAFDLERIRGKAVLRLARLNERMTPMFASRDVSLREGEIVYADESRVFSRYSKDCDFTKITKETTKILCVVDQAPGMEVDIVRQAQKALAEILADVAGAINIEMGYASGHV